MVGMVHFRRNGAEVACRCRSCAAKWTVRLDPQQLLRLVVRPPEADDGPWMIHLHLPGSAFPWL